MTDLSTCLKNLFFCTKRLNAHFTSQLPQERGIICNAACCGEHLIFGTSCSIAISFPNHIRKGAHDHSSIVLKTGKYFLTIYAPSSICYPYYAKAGRYMANSLPSFNDLFDLLSGNNMVYIHWVNFS